MARNAVASLVALALCCLAAGALAAKGPRPDAVCAGLRSAPKSFDKCEDWREDL
jgi:hypothetical protein